MILYKYHYTQPEHITHTHGTYAQFTVLDPSYTMTVPFDQFLSGGFDTLSHCMETYFGKNENVSDDMNEAVMRDIIKNIRKAVLDSSDEDAALAGIQALADFIAELKLPQSFTDLGLEVSDETLMTIAQTCRISQGCVKRLSPEEILEILKECR